MSNNNKVFAAIVSDKTNRRKLIEAKFSRHTVYAWAGGKRIPTRKSAERISRVLGVPLHLIPYHDVVNK